MEAANARAIELERTNGELGRQLLASKEQLKYLHVARRSEAQVQSLLLSLRKTCNHPQLFGSWMADLSSQAGEDLATSSGKLATLSRLLDELLPEGHRVVLFSQFTSTLDLLGDFLTYRGYKFCRLDGSPTRVQRQVGTRASQQQHRRE